MNQAPDRFTAAGLNTLERIEQKLAVLSPESVDLIDNSEKHAGHEGAKSGGGHYRMRVVAACFAGRTRIERHRLVYDALGDLMRREIHALAMTLLAPNEADADPTESPPRK